MKKKVEYKNKVVVIGASLFVLAMVIFPEITETGSKTAILIWINSIVPALLPFFIFSEFIKNTGDLQKLPHRIYPWVMAFLSGYPMGAKVVGDFVREEKLTGEEGKHVLSYALVTGPAFMIFTIGDFIGSNRAAICVVLAHYTGAFLNGALNYCKISEKKQQKLVAEKRLGYMENFTCSIMAGFKGMAMILAFLMIFTIGIDIMEHIGLFKITENQVLSSFCKGLFEMTVGIKLVGMCNIGMRLKTIIAATLVSFGGLSVIGQSASMMQGCNIGFVEILKVKFTHGIIAAIIATLLVNIMVI